MKDNLCGTLVGPSNSCDALRSLVLDPFLGIPQWSGPWLQREVPSFVLISGRRVSGHSPHAVGVAF